MKKVLSILLASALLIMMMAGCSSNSSKSSSGAQSAAGSSAADDNKVYKIKFSTVLNENSTWYKMGQRIAENMEKETNGRILISCFANEQLSGGNQQKGCEMLMNGSTEMDARSNMLWSVIDEKLGVYAIPFFYDSLEALDAIVAGEGGKAHAEVMDKYGVHLIGIGEYGDRLIATNKPVKSYEDMAGKKIRVASVPLHLNAMQAFGANPMAMNWSEMYTGLQQGTVDGMEAPAQVLIDNTVYEVCKYAYDCAWVSDPMTFGVNKEFYESLPDDLRTIFDKVCNEGLEWQKTEQRQLNETAKKRLAEEFKVEITVIDPADKAKFEKAMESVVADYETKVGKDYLDKFRG